MPRFEASASALKNTDMERFELHLHDFVSEYSPTVNASSVVAQLSSRPDLPVEVFINSKGGDVYEGFAIYNALRRHRSPVTTRVDNAFSIASVISQAGSRRLIGPGGMMMIHNPFYDGFGGEAGDLREAADMLDKVAQQIAAIYATRSGKSVEEALDYMAKTSWFTADEAVEWGLADAIEGMDFPVPADAPAALWSPTVVSSLRACAPHAAVRGTVYALHATGGVFAVTLSHATTNNETMKPTLIQRLRAAFGLPDNATEDEIVSVLNAAEAEETEETEETPTDETPQGEAPEQAQDETPEADETETAESGSDEAEEEAETEEEAGDAESPKAEAPEAVVSDPVVVQPVGMADEDAQKLVNSLVRQGAITPVQGRALRTLALRNAEAARVFAADLEPLGGIPRVDLGKAPAPAEAEKGPVSRFIEERYGRD